MTTGDTGDRPPGPGRQRPEGPPPGALRRVATFYLLFFPPACAVEYVIFRLLAVPANPAALLVAITLAVGTFFYWLPMIRVVRRRLPAVDPDELVMRSIATVIFSVVLGIVAYVVLRAVGTDPDLSLGLAIIIGLDLAFPLAYVSARWLRSRRR